METQISELEETLIEKCIRYREALMKIANSDVAPFLPYGTSSYTDTELRAIAREALVAPVGIESLERWVE